MATRVAKSGRNFGSASERCVNERPQCGEREMARAEVGSYHNFLKFSKTFPNSQFSPIFPNFPQFSPIFPNFPKYYQKVPEFGRNLDFYTSEIKAEAPNTL